MPLVRIDMHSALAPEQARLSAAIHRGLVAGLQMPVDDLFQIFTLHEPGELIYTRTFPDADRSDIIFIQILLARMYSDEEKRRMYSRLVEELKGVGVKPDNLLIALTENGGVDWFAPAKEA
jgi:hypothetical protein